jgi:hypothetical protein
VFKDMDLTDEGSIADSTVVKTGANIKG